MAKFPEPPDAPVLRTSPPEEMILAAGTRLWRVYSAGGPHALAWNELRCFGPTDGRFDPQRPPAHSDPDRAVCYLGDVAPLCLAERFQAHRRVERHVGDPHLVGFDLVGPVRLLDLITVGHKPFPGSPVGGSRSRRPRAREPGAQHRLPSSCPPRSSSTRLCDAHHHRSGSAGGSRWP